MLIMGCLELNAVSLARPASRMFQLASERVDSPGQWTGQTACSDLERHFRLRWGCGTGRKAALNKAAMGLPVSNPQRGG